MGPRRGTEVKVLVVLSFLTVSGVLAATSPVAHGQASSDGTGLLPTLSIPSAAPPPTTLSLSPGSGPVTTLVAATGTGFAPNMSIAFSVNGNPAASTCLTDSTGDFPGTSGTPCSFAVPPAPNSSGSEDVVATGRTDVSGFGFPGSTSFSGTTTPVEALYVPSTGQIFVSSFICTYVAPSDCQGIVNLISTANDSVAGAIEIGQNDFLNGGMGYDSDTEQVFVAGSSGISVIDTSNDSIVAVVPAAANEYPDGSDGFAYDPVTKVMYMANGSSVLAISTSNDSVAATIPDSNGPLGVVYDPATATVFVSNSGSDSVSVISPATESVIATIPTCINPWGLAYDPNTGEIFVACVTGDVEAISGTSDTVVATITVGGYPQFVTYDSATEEIFVDTLNDGVSVLSPAYNAVNQSIPDSSDPQGLTYDPVDGKVFVADYGQAVTVIAPVSPTITSSAIFIASPLLTLTPPVYGVPGTLVSTQGLGFAGSAQVSFSFGGVTVPSSCRTGHSGSFASVNSTVCTFVVPSLAPGSSYSVLASTGATVASAPYTIDLMNLSASDATVGSLVQASGVGFPAKNPVAFVVGGVAVPSDCSIDVLGDFPGTSGTPCTFAVPELPHGTYSVDGLAEPTAFSNIGVLPGLGENAYVFAYDSGTGQLFAVNGGNTVSVVNATNLTTVATIPVGDQECACNFFSYGITSGIAYDSGTAQIFVSNGEDGTVSVINDSGPSADTVVANVTVGGLPTGIAYDSGTNQLFVSNAGTDNVSVINDSGPAADTVVGTVPVGLSPSAIAYDPDTSQVFVVNTQNNSVSVIDDSGPSADTVVAWVTVGNDPIDIAYDQKLGQMFVTNLVDGTVSVISEVTDDVIATIGVGEYPIGVAYDGAGNVYVTNAGSCSESVIWDETGTVTDTVPVDCYPFGVIYDPVSGDVLTGMIDSNNLVNLVKGTNGAEFETTLTVIPGLQTASTVDANSTMVVQGSGFNASVLVPSFTLGGIPLPCVSASAGACVAGAITTGPKGSFEVSVDIPSATFAPGNYSLVAIDASGNTANSTVTVTSDPVSGTITASRSNVDLGQNLSFAIGPATFGVGPYQYRWFGLPPGCRASSVSFTCTPTATGNFSVTVAATDADGYSVTSPAFTLAVFSDPTVSEPTAAPNSGGVDAGQNLTLNATASGGTGDYSYFTWSGLPTGCAGVTATVVCSGSELPAGTYSVSVTVTDSTGFTSNPSPSLSLVVYPYPTAAAPTSNRSSADVGQSITLQESSGALVGGYDYSWSGLPAGCTGGDSFTLSCRVTTAGTFTVRATVTDLRGYSAESPPLLFTVYPDPTVSLNASQTALDEGQSVTFTAAVTGGSGYSTYSWSNLLIDCTASSATLTCSPKAAGTYSEQVSATDSNGLTAVSAKITLTVSSAIVATVSANVTQTVVGSDVTFTSSGSGGTGALTYSWSFGDGSSGLGATVTHAYSTVGNYTVTVWVNDSVGGSVEDRLTVEVTRTVTSSGAGSSSPGVNLAEIGAIAAVLLAAVILVFLLARRRRKARDGASAVRPGADSRNLSVSPPGTAGADGEAEPEES